ncbi:MAG: esterase-like activity of phytase family protein [Hyphomicrobium sp.]
MLALATCVVLTTTLALADNKPQVKSLRTGAFDLQTAALPAFDKLGGQRTRYGKLEWRGGLVLTSQSKNFGGWSGLSFAPDGRKFVAVSDSGAWMTGEVTYDGRMLAGVRDARMGPLMTQAGTPLQRNRDRDAEAVTLLTGTLDRGTLLVAFEQNARVARYDITPDGVSPTRAFMAMPKEALNRMKRNSGIEAMAVLKGGPRKGAMIAFAERRFEGAEHHAGWIWRGETPERISITDIDDFDLADMAALDDGSVLVLERRFRWLEGVKMRIRKFDAGELKPGAVAAGEILIEADLEREIDNMEGLAVSRGPSGETLLTLISDDNFNGFLQRTLLLQFAMAESDTAKARP